MLEPVMMHPSTTRTAPALVVSQTGARRGFTLVEILIVVVILGILAAIAVPRLSNASAAARESTLHDDMRFLRTQIVVYRAAHHDVYPGYPGGNTAATPTDVDFVAQMTLYTDEFGNTSPTGSAVYKFGPYLREMPVDPINSLTTITIVPSGSVLTPDGTTGWLYQPTTGQIMPNLTGNDSDGNAFSNY